MPKYYVHMEQLHVDVFQAEWNKAYLDWQNRFSAKSRKTNTATWCHIWNGPHCMLDERELIPGETIVIGTHTDPEFLTPAEFMLNYAFTNRNPLTLMPEPNGTRYKQRLNKIKIQILSNS